MRAALSVADNGQAAMTLAKAELRNAVKNER